MGSRRKNLSTWVGTTLLVVGAEMLIAFPSTAAAGMSLQKAPPAVEKAATTTSEPQLDMQALKARLRATKSIGWVPKTFASIKSRHPDRPVSSLPQRSGTHCAP